MPRLYCTGVSFMDLFLLPTNVSYWTSESLIIFYRYQRTSFVTPRLTLSVLFVTSTSKTKADISAAAADAVAAVVVADSGLTPGYFA